ncbi:uncharacterized protein orion [Prorops nasuta]|uniref:uncharacterized protein orion n=1 Tax=Prorops nasuta TaxID=863751 RepID=UPI0034CD174C
MWLKRKGSLAIFFALMAFFQPGDGFDVNFGDITEILRFGKETLSDALETWEIIRSRNPDFDTNEQFPFQRNMERRIINQIREVAKDIQKLGQKQETQINIMREEILQKIPMQQRLEFRIQDFQRVIYQINNKYEQFRAISAKTETFSPYTLKDFAATCVSTSIGQLPDQLKLLHRLIVPQEDDVFETSILVLLSNQFKEAAARICNNRQSPQQLLYNLYTTVALSEIKGFAMIQFSYVLLRVYNSSLDFTEEMEQLKEEYYSRTSETIRAVKTAMAFAPRDMYLCNPNKHKPDETYTELKQLFQGYIVNEVDMNSDSTCRQNCAYYSYAKVYGCYKNQFCSQQRRCNGKLVNCEYVDSDMWVCPSDRNSNRRYEYITYEDGRQFGQQNTCPRLTKVDSWWRWLFWHCSYCFCYCDDHNKNSDRYVNLRNVTSDIENNRVVTGIKFTKNKQIIHIQIQEGELQPRANINASTIEWKPVDDYSIFDEHIMNTVDYHTLSWEKRAIDMDDLTYGDDHVLTGARFRVVGTRLNLEIRVTPFNFTTGQLFPEKSVWHSNDITERSELQLKNADIPIRTLLDAEPDSLANQYLNFAASDREKDAAQSTIPFIDLQAVAPKPPTALSGAGVYHKGSKGSGGFVALKLITFNYEPHLQADVPPIRPIISESPNEIQAV